MKYPCCASERCSIIAIRSIRDVVLIAAKLTVFESYAASTVSGDEARRPLPRLDDRFPALDDAPATTWDHFADRHVQANPYELYIPTGPVDPMYIPGRARTVLRGAAIVDTPQLIVPQQRPIEPTAPAVRVLVMAGLMFRQAAV